MTNVPAANQQNEPIIAAFVIFPGARPSRADRKRAASSHSQFVSIGFLVLIPMPPPFFFLLFFLASLRGNAAKRGIYLNRLRWNETKIICDFISSCLKLIENKIRRKIVCSVSETNNERNICGRRTIRESERTVADFTRNSAAVKRIGSTA